MPDMIQRLEEKQSKEKGLNEKATCETCALRGVIGFAKTKKKVWKELVVMLENVWRLRSG